MAKNSDQHRILAAPASASSSVATEHAPYVSGAILEKAKAGRSASPVPATAAVPAAPVWPRLDDYLDEPDETSRWERIGGERKEAMPATPGHGDPHFKLDALLDAHLAEDYVGSVDLKTRVSKKHEYASDTCVRRAGIDPATESRYLEELVFEVVHKRSKKDTKTRARGFAARGVRRQIGIFVEQKTIREWLASDDDWGQPLDLGRNLRDPCLAVPLPLAAFFDPALAKEAIARALEAKDDPVILEIKDKSEKRGRAQGKSEGIEEGEKRARAEAILTVLDARGFVLSEEQRERIRATTDPETLRRWLRRAASASSLEEVLDEAWDRGKSNHPV